MKYVSPNYQREEAMSLDVITASWAGNNCTVNDDATPTFSVPGAPEDAKVTQISGLLNSLIRK